MMRRMRRRRWMMRDMMRRRRRRRRSDPTGLPPTNGRVYIAANASDRAAWRNCSSTSVLVC
eukprot:4339723-Pyramimonas_sp.AAC.1